MLYCLEEAFHHGILIRVAGVCHAYSKAISPQLQSHGNADTGGLRQPYPVKRLDGQPLDEIVIVRETVH